MFIIAHVSMRNSVSVHEFRLKWVKYVPCDVGHEVTNWRKNWVPVRAFLSQFVRSPTHTSSLSRLQDIRVNHISNILSDLHC